MPPNPTPQKSDIETPSLQEVATALETFSAPFQQSEISQSPPPSSTTSSKTKVKTIKQAICLHLSPFASLDPTQKPTMAFPAPYTNQLSTLRLLLEIPTKERNLAPINPKPTPSQSQKTSHLLSLGYNLPIPSRQDGYSRDHRRASPIHLCKESTKNPPCDTIIS